MGIPSPFLQLQWWGLWPPPGTLASLPFHLAVFGLPDPVRPSVTSLALSCQALLFALTLARAGRIQGESLAAWASVGPRVGSLARWHLLHKLPLARPCGSQSNPPLPAGPHPSSAEPGLSKTDAVPRTAVGRKKAGFGFCDREARSGERPLPRPPPSPQHPVIQRGGDRQDPAAWPPAFPPDCLPATSWGEPLGQMVVSSSSVWGGLRPSLWGIP